MKIISYNRENTKLLKDITSFDLSILNTEGLEEIQKQIEIVIEMILEELSEIALN